MDGTDTPGDPPPTPGGGAEIRTFLIADVRGYTLFTQERGDEAAGKLAAKFAGVAREGVERFGGEVIELRGDEALAVFVSPRQAIRAAVELQGRFADESDADPSLPLPVGIGLDAGEAVPIEGGWRGGALNLAARLCGQAGPGEVLASREVVHLARKVDGIRYADRGALHLKGMAEPVEAVRVLPEGEDPTVRMARFRPAPPAPLRRRSRGRLRRIAIPVVALVLVASVVAGVVAFRGGGSGSTGPTTIAADSVGAFALRTGAMSGQASMDARPGQIAAGEGSVWVTHGAEGTLSRIDPATHAVIQTIDVGTDPSGVAVGDGSVWVANSQDRTLDRIDPQSDKVVDPIVVGNGPSGVAIGEGSVWVTNSLDDTVARVDPATDKVTAVIPVAGTPIGIATGKDSVWVAESTAGQVARIDPASNAVIGSTSVGNAPRAIATDGGSVWVANSLDGTVSRLSAGTGTVDATVPTGAGTNGIAVSGNDVWATNEYDATLSRIDARTNASVATIHVGNAPAGAAILGQSLWVAASGAPSSHQGGTLVIASTKGGFTSTMDPTAGPFFAVQSLVYDTLVGYKRVGGVDGSTLVPDLAEKIPAPTDGGLSYTFTLRSGLLYSDGSPVRATDVLPSFERAFKVTDPFVGGPAIPDIVGSDACWKKPDTCDLSKGIVASGNTVTLHLAAPDPYFLYHIALPPAVVIPADAPDSDMGTHPIPGTGPYEIDEFVRKNHVTLGRNPNFHEWSRAAQPAGFPDQIEWKVVATQAAGVQTVNEGDADVYGWNEDLKSHLVDQIFTRYTSQGHAYTYAGPWAMYLNTEVPPFDKIEVRQALAFAIDRRQVQRRYPGGRSAITCQAIPPNFPGYLPYCPYTVTPDLTGTWTAPDLGKAHELVAAAGTAGMKVTILSWSEFASVSRYFASVLNDLGYKAHVQVFSDFGAFYSRLVDSKNRVQAGGFWASTDPVPSEIFQFTICNEFLRNNPLNDNAAEFCNQTVDAAYDHARALDLTDPTAAREGWSALDHKVTDLAPFIPAVIPEGVEFLSKRTGNYQHNPSLGILLSQLWVT